MRFRAVSRKCCDRPEKDSCFLKIAGGAALIWHRPGYSSRESRSALFRQIEVHGDYSTDEPGTYTLTYTAMDSDGNVSAPVTLELVVKG